MMAPHGIAIHRDNLYITDTRAHALFKFKIETDMRFVAKLGNPIFGARRFNSPRGLSVSAKGDVFIADSNNNRIQILDHSLHVQTRIKHETLMEPLDVEVMSSVMSLPAYSLTQERRYAP